MLPLHWQKTKVKMGSVDFLKIMKIVQNTESQITVIWETVLFLVVRFFFFFSLWISPVDYIDHIKYALLLV